MCFTNACLRARSDVVGLIERMHATREVRLSRTVWCGTCTQSDVLEVNQFLQKVDFVKLYSRECGLSLHIIRLSPIMFESHRKEF